ncbi:MAG: hypothetical protein Q9176_003904 [Flavoplaca citrina]
MSNRPPSANPQKPNPDDLYSLHTSRPSLDISAFSKDFNYRNNPSRSLDAFSNFIKQRSSQFEVFSNSTTAHNHGIGPEQMRYFFEKRSKEMDALEALVQDWKVEYLKGLIRVTMADTVDPATSRPILNTSTLGATYKQFCSNHDALHAIGKFVKERGNGIKESATDLASKYPQMTSYIHDENQRMNALLALCRVWEKEMFLRGFELLSEDMDANMWGPKTLEWV